MATNSLHSIQHHHHHCSFIKPTKSNTNNITFSQLFLKPIKTNTNITLSNNILLPSCSCSSSSISCVAFSLSQATSTTSSSTSDASTVSFELLSQLLSAKDYQKADEETRRLLIVLAGDAAQKRGYVFFSEVQFISEHDLRAIDELWRNNSDNKFGYSVQKRIFEKVNGDFTKFFIKVGWMKKLDTEVEQYNYRSFPSEFIWEMNDETPEGHLPLTNALRGTQLLNNILNHPAFDAVQEEGGEGDFAAAVEDKVGAEGNNGAITGLKEKNDESSSPKQLSKRVFKPDYSF